MLTLHHLEYSQSFRILWLLEELGADYLLERYDRDPKSRLAPDDLKQLSPLGTAPVVTDDAGLVLAESNAAIDYILDSYPDSPLRPGAGDPSRADYLFWFHAGNGSLMPMQFMNGILTMMEARSPALMRPMIKAVTSKVRDALVRPRLKRIFDLMEEDLGRHMWLAGDTMTAADITLVYSIFSAEDRGHIDANRPNIGRWIAQVRKTPSFQRATEKDGRETIVFSF
ncbi:glutathione S-transferase family protein [Pseudoblastomonas halimionae]|uniref:Glutathione S-transferase family protein n=1 Tax=Alteriqipengyuania halimionae TaxID=1926630 RepID=A0A6I4TZZ3_9SPHN|nr:glutathione S-transferase family protein [Alteriqipengyuania halimionae]MXP09379.1 glutathione S-transferase family protein [Alteriqipengyuania halimionae]